MNFLTRAVAALAATVCVMAPTAHASVVITGTRVIFNAAQGEATVRLTNENSWPALVEAWIDDGDEKSTPDTAKTPFLITPPLFRMDAHKDQSLRIVFVPGAQPLPTNRESVFYLNVLEIPPKPTGTQFAGKNYLQFAIRTRIKLFYRPAKLPGDVQKAPDQLTFTPAGNAAIEIHNPTPYYVTIDALALGANAKPDADNHGMIAPLSDLKLALKGTDHTPAVGTPVVFGNLDDYGSERIHSGVITQ